MHRESEHNTDGTREHVFFWFLCRRRLLITLRRVFTKWRYCSIMIIDDKYTTTAGETKKTNTQNQYERLCVFANTRTRTIHLFSFINNEIY